MMEALHSNSVDFGHLGFKYLEAKLTSAIAHQNVQFAPWSAPAFKGSGLSLLLLALLALVVSIYPYLAAKKLALKSVKVETHKNGSRNSF